MQVSRAHIMPHLHIFNNHDDVVRGNHDTNTSRSKLAHFNMKLQIYLGNLLDSCPAHGTGREGAGAKTQGPRRVSQDPLLVPLHQGIRAGRADARVATRQEHVLHLQKFTVNMIMTTLQMC